MAPTAVPTGPFRPLARLAAVLSWPAPSGAYRRLVDPLAPGVDVRAEVVSVTPETPRAATVTLRPGAGWQPHRPGQWVSVGVDIDGVRHHRCYSITSLPHGHRPDGHRRADRGLLTITVQQVPDGIVSNHLVQRIRPGDVVHLDGPEGDFTLDPDPAPTTGADHPPTAPGRPLLFITGGSGITPVIGMLRALDAGADTAPDATLDDVVVVNHAPSDSESLFTDELDALARRHRGLRVVHVRTGAGAPPPEMELNAGRLDDLCPDWRDREAWTCGPRPMVEAVESLWSGPDHATTRALHVERFTPSIPDGLPEVEGTLTFRAAGVSVPSDGTRTVLDAAEDAGLSPLAGCRMGVCRRCVVPLHSGTVVDRRDGRIECEPGAHVQICVTAAVGDVEIEI